MFGLTQFSAKRVYVVHVVHVLFFYRMRRRKGGPSAGIPRVMRSWVSTCTAHTTYTRTLSEARKHWWFSGVCSAFQHTPDVHLDRTDIHTGTSYPVPAS